MYKSLITKLTNQINQHSNPAEKSWFENYIKNSAPFRGVKMPVVRKELHKWHKDYIDGEMDLDQQLDLAFALIEEKYTEDKIAGTMFMQEILIPKGIMKPKRNIKRLSELFSNGHIYDWNVCDWFCMKVLGELIVKDEKYWARPIHMWHSAENLWQARASLVSFERVSDNQDYFSMIEKSCKKLIKREERFAKTAVGWLLREISKQDEDFVKQFIEHHIKHFTAETIRNALKYSSKDEKKHYLTLLKSV
ncbi:MAG TPA: DNA alkylation repair protein [Thermodesulfobacteriota bacterium]|nr:DNA alkylation repair protein [Thermodesulfobacteriota bacterium]